MRNRFAKVMEDMALEHPDVCLLSGDIGNRMFDNFKKIAPARFINCGIAEANMIGLAAGMARAPQMAAGGARISKGRSRTL